jgi:hypothetical protein
MVLPSLFHTNRFAALFIIDLNKNKNNRILAVVENKIIFATGIYN